MTGPRGAGSPGLRLGAPGVYRDDRRPAPAFRPVRLDVAGFVGVAPRGPVDLPVALDSWSDYLRRFGGFEGPGLLPYAVREFFAQGGTRAYVLRVAPLPRSPEPEAGNATALHRTRLTAADGSAPQDLDLRARDEGSWGQRLSVHWEFVASRHFLGPLDGRELTLPDALAPPIGSLLRIRGPGLPPAGSYALVTALADRPAAPGLRRRVALLDRPTLPAPDTAEVDLVTAGVTVDDADPAQARQERFTDLGLSSAHPRFVGDVLTAESLLVVPDGPWPSALLPPDAFLGAADSGCVRPGADRWAGIGADSFFGPLPPELLPVGGSGTADGEEPPGGAVADIPGVDRMSLVAEVALLAVPDLLWQYSVPTGSTEIPVRPAGPEFAPCPPAPVPTVYTPPPQQEVLLDGRTQLPEILRRQGRLVALAERQRRFVALLDVPPGLPVRLVARWRAGFDSSYAAAYHPWLGVVATEAGPGRLGGGQAVLVPPSAFAAGIIAQREQRLGIPWGPANVLAVDAVTAADRPTAAELDQLHLLDIDTFHAERDGFRLASARTLSRDPDYRQLSVRRLMTMLRLVLERQAQSLAFEPDSPQLRAELRGAVTQLLRDLFRDGALAGADEDQAFFVRCDEGLNPAWSQGLGRLVAEVGVAPAQPLEYLVLRIAQDADGAPGVTG
ncbi:phage tail sheath C-terminal domain-containing protein [Saccharothrix sp. ST-888]|uniref:phage tail sheath C-terminal domain-containing protein n=1 Tax=Saccharothrix sp. ST-888 TaxID=1427391 RepID=UPI0005ECA22B|nr:phage tail sheath C-terminal domain-containing protein [Saccharothrix sp. ST-888]